jgi:hypothetical protein
MLNPSIIGILAIYERIRQHFRQGPLAQKRDRPPDRRTEPEHRGSPNAAAMNELAHPHALPPPPTYHAAVNGGPNDQTAAQSAYGVSQGFPELSPSPYHQPGWRPLSADGAGPWRADAISHSYTGSQDLELDGGLEPTQLPFGDLNAEDLWNWMFLIDSEDHSHGLLQAGL